MPGRKRSLGWVILNPILLGSGISWKIAWQGQMLRSGHSSFATTYEFYLAVADNLADRARVATAQGLRKKMVHFGVYLF